jgi:protein associated with RNAse G/E
MIENSAETGKKFIKSMHRSRNLNWEDHKYYKQQHCVCWGERKIPFNINSIVKIPCVNYGINVTTALFCSESADSVLRIIKLLDSGRKLTWDEKMKNIELMELNKIIEAVESTKLKMLEVIKRNRPKNKIFEDQPIEFENEETLSTPETED